MSEKRKFPVEEEVVEEEKLPTPCGIVEEETGDELKPEGFEPKARGPSLLTDFDLAKAYLQQYGDTKNSVWDHLTAIITRLVEEQPRNVIDYFEEYCKVVRLSNDKPERSNLIEQYEISKKLEESIKMVNMLREGLIEEHRGGEEGGDEGEEESKAIINVDILGNLSLLQRSGCGLPEKDAFAINVSVNLLAYKERLTKVRYWGKIFGLCQDYFVVEAELTADEIQRRLALEGVGEEGEENEDIMEDDDILPQAEMAQEEEGVLGEGVELPALGPYSDDELLQMKPPVKLLKYTPPLLPAPVEEEKDEPAPEPLGEGVNRKIIYVCNDPSSGWVQLPNVKPKHIQAARKIRKLFTGCLNSVMNTVPKFPGTEAYYLRAQIARISASTQVSPLGYYQFSGSGEEGVEDAMDEELMGDGKDLLENPDYDPLSVTDLVDPTLAYWVHHVPHILKQGRTTFWSKRNENAGEEEGDEEDDMGLNDVPVEKGPPLLTPLSEDASIESVPPWTVRRSSNFMGPFSHAIIRSNLWPGAYTCALGRHFENTYFGWGLKYTCGGFSPTCPPLPQSEYTEGPDVKEMLDPTPAMEQLWITQHTPPPIIPMLFGEGEGEEMGDGVPHDNDDDD